MDRRNIWHVETEIVRFRRKPFVKR